MPFEDRTWSYPQGEQSPYPASPTGTQWVYSGDKSTYEDNLRASSGYAYPYPSQYIPQMPPRPTDQEPPDIVEVGPTPQKRHPIRSVLLLLISIALLAATASLLREFVIEPIEAALDQVGFPGAICTEEGHESALLADWQGRCPAPIHILETTGDGSRPVYIPTKQRTLWDELDEKQEAKIARIEEEKRIAAEQEAARLAAAKAQDALSVPAGTASYSEAAPAAPMTLSPMQISSNGYKVSYIDSYGWSSAPQHGAGLWHGSDSVTDGDLGYFIGHHPGDFNFVMGIGVGDQITVKDRYGNQRSYTAQRVFNYPQAGYMEDVLDKIGSWGESVILQTCLGDGYTVRIVFAE